MIVNMHTLYYEMHKIVIYCSNQYITIWCSHTPLHTSATTSRKPTKQLRTIVTLTAS